MLERPPEASAEAVEASEGAMSDLDVALASSGKDR